MRARGVVDFRGRVVVITGGSRGLGLNLARQFAEQGAHLAILSRDKLEIERAERELRALGAKVFSVDCDLTDKSAAQKAIADVVNHYGALDVLINNAGAIQVGPMEHMGDTEFRGDLDLHFWAPLWLSRAALPHLKKSGQGRIVNIASFGGLIPMPHMAPYNVSKFAQVALSDSMRHEFAKDGVRITTVCPGIIRTGSHLAATFKGRQKLEYKMFKLGAGLPFTATEAPVAARKIIEAARYGDPQLTFPLPMFWFSVIYRAFPNASSAMLALIARLMPGPVDEEGDELMAGAEIEAELPSSPLTKLADQAALAHNELNGHALDKAL